MKATDRKKYRNKQKIKKREINIKGRKIESSKEVMKEEAKNEESKNRKKWRKKNEKEIKKERKENNYK
jgi:hypothetical protein